jgi:hypothetical protein
MATSESPQGAREFVRVVALRGSEMPVADFRLRPGETGLSTFVMGSVPVHEIVAAVRAMGKRGDLHGAAVPMKFVRDLGLTVVVTPGGTQRPEVNDLHVEIRVPLLRRVWLWCKGGSTVGYFNETIAPQLHAAARLAD